MKQCSTCRTTYTDDSLRFCLADGGTLISVPDSEATVVLPKREQVRVDIDNERQPVTADAGPSTKKIVLVIGLFAVLILGAAVVAAALLYFNRDSRKATVASTPTPAVAASATPDIEKQKLQDQLANIQRQLDEQKAADKTSASVPAATPSDVSDASELTAVNVNSPNDGFLALRDKPHAEFGNRIQKIPHGVTITIGKCGPIQRRLGGRAGRWCTAAYNGKAGFVFDAFLDRE